MGYFGNPCFAGVSSGWLGAAVALAFVCALVYLQERRRLPVVALACLLPYVLFFQAGKADFRRTYWYGDVQSGVIQRIEYWTKASIKQWQEAFEDSSGRRVAYLLNSSLSRTSLLTQAANVIEQTPTPVPYQHGRLYSYLAVALVPRLFWPEKPSMNEANQFYQVAYGVTSPRDLDHISIAVGALTEGFMNFGWLGTVAVMFFIGVLLDFWNKTFLIEAAPHWLPGSASHSFRNY